MRRWERTFWAGMGGEGWAEGWKEESRGVGQKPSLVGSWHCPKGRQVWCIATLVSSDLGHLLNLRRPIQASAALPWGSGEASSPQGRAATPLSLASLPIPTQVRIVL